MLDYIFGEMGEFGVRVLQDVALAWGGGGYFFSKNLDTPFIFHIFWFYKVLFPFKIPQPF